MVISRMKVIIIYVVIVNLLKLMLWEDSLLRPVTHQLTNQ